MPSDTQRAGLLAVTIVAAFVTIAVSVGALWIATSEAEYKPEPIMQPAAPRQQQVDTEYDDAEAGLKRFQNVAKQAADERQLHPPDDITRPRIKR